MRSLISENPTNWDDYLPYVFLAYRSSVHETTKCTPNLLWYGTELRLLIDLIYKECREDKMLQCPCQFVEWVKQASSEAFDKAQENIERAAERQEKYYNKNSLLRTFEVGQFVWVLNPALLQKKFGRAWQGPFLVVKKLNIVNYVVQQSPDSRLITCMH